MTKKKPFVFCLYSDKDKTALTLQTPFRLRRSKARGCDRTAERKAGATANVLISLGFIFSIECLILLSFITRTLWCRLNKSLV